MDKDPREHLKKAPPTRRKKVSKEDDDLPLSELEKRLLSNDDIDILNERLAHTKELLKQEIESNMEINRCVRAEAIDPKNIVSIFDSCLTRCLDMSTTELNDSLVIVKVYYFGVAENIIKRGFWMNGEHYVFFSASAGQIRTKKFVAIKETALDKCRNTLTCGLSGDAINSMGGVNINKYLAYLALCNSATTPWEDFDIERTIVIDDFETNVRGVVDFIDEKTYQITRQEMDVPITHTDGCGMILPSISKKNFMVRAPWVKGLLSPFDFAKFVREANRAEPGVNHGQIVDIYGVTHDVLDEKIEVIFTKSQFKMWKYYANWAEYQQKFKEFGCSAGKCNEEPDYVEDAKFNYQMLQTLTSMKDEELAKVCERTNKKLRDMTSDRHTMLRVFGATKDPDSMNAYQKSLSYYPELLQDPYSREVLRDLKNSTELRGIAGRLDISGKYLFLLPDLYAACDHWFNGVETPVGLLKNGQVSSRVYASKARVDALRSPHLYREHAVRDNIYSSNEVVKKWFKTDGIYTSSYDLISKILQFDKLYC